jgi:predicted secreted protein
MAEPVNGTNITLWKLDATYGNIPFACGRSCTFQSNMSVKNVTNYQSNYWEEFKPDMLSWDMSVEGLVINSNYSYIRQLQDQRNRQSFYISFMVDNGADFAVYSGYAFFTNISIQGSYDNMATVNATLQGTGAYTVSATPINPNPGTEMTTYRTYYEAAGGETSFVVADLIGCNALLYASRGGIDSTDIITTGTPTGGEVKIDATTGTIYIDATNPLIAGEWLNFLFR